MKHNDTVNTPVGPGTYLGEFEVHAPGQDVETMHLFEVPVDDNTRPHLHSPNCMTPRASIYAKFYFSRHELS